jgi:tRNA 2-thiouridine synthesizing protein A
MEHDDTLDAVGLLCPLPVLKARKRLKSLQTGQVLRMVASDPAAQIDVPHFCTEAGHTFLGTGESGENTAYYIKKN